VASKQRPKGVLKRARVQRTGDLNGQRQVESRNVCLKLAKKPGAFLVV